MAQKRNRDEREKKRKERESRRDGKTRIGINERGDRREQERQTNIESRKAER